VSISTRDTYELGVMQAGKSFKPLKIFETNLSYHAISVMNFGKLKFLIGPVVRGSSFPFTFHVSAGNPKHLMDHHIQTHNINPVFNLSHKHRTSYRTTYMPVIYTQLWKLQV
jgi:hypothetical protein